MAKTDTRTPELEAMARELAAYFGPGDYTDDDVATYLAALRRVYAMAMADAAGIAQGEVERIQALKERWNPRVAGAEDEADALAAAFEAAAKEDPNDG